MMRDGTERRVVWAPDSLEQLREFPEHVRWVFGRALYKGQTGSRHEAATAMRGRLGGIVEVASDHAGDTYRAYYTLKCPGRVYVLHCHKKKSKRGAALPKREADLLARRFGDALADCERGESKET
jgi:phage-related protein